MMEKKIEKFQFNSQFCSKQVLELRNSKKKKGVKKKSNKIISIELAVNAGDKKKT